MIAQSSQSPWARLNESSLVAPPPGPVVLPGPVVPQGLVVVPRSLQHALDSHCGFLGKVERDPWGLDVHLS